MIDPIIHVAAVGSHSKTLLSDLCKQHISAWAELNPSTAIFVHGNEAIHEFEDNPFMGIAVYRKWDANAISDLLRFLILQKHGGLYTDCDIKPLASVEHLLESKYKVILAQRYGFPRISSAPIAFAKGSDVIAKMLDSIGLEAFDNSATPIRAWHYENALSKLIDETFMVLPPDSFNATSKDKAKIGIHEHPIYPFNGYYSKSVD